MKDDAISRQAAKLKVARVIWEDGESFSDFHDKCVDCLDDVPSAQPEQLKVLANILDGCPLTYPCDTLWSGEGWCRQHCKSGQDAPDTDCWLRYAEVVANG